MTRLLIFLLAATLIVGCATTTPQNTRDSNTTVQEASMDQKAQEKSAAKKVKFWPVLPILVEKDDTQVHLGHLSLIRFAKKDSGKSGLMLLELLGYEKGPKGWKVRIALLEFGTAK